MLKGKRLRELRELQKISAEELGKSLGMTKQQILRYEAEKNDCTSTTLADIADFFDVTADYLLGRSDVISPPRQDTRRVLSYTIDIMALLRVFPPEKVAQTIKAAGIPIKLKGDVIDIPALLNEFPEEKVGLFLAALDIPFSVKSTKDKPSEHIE